MGDGASLHDDWTRIVFSDETSIQLVPNKLVGLGKKGYPIKAGRHRKGKKVHVWAAISFNSKSEPFIFEQISQLNYSENLILKSCQNGKC
jgi:hypothetical protein